MTLYNLTRRDAGVYTCLVSTSSKEAGLISNESAEIYQNTDDTYIEALKVKLIIRTVPCAVSRITVRISTILGVLIWEYNRNTSANGYPLKSFTAEFRQHTADNSTPKAWERLDPINISPNIVSISYQLPIVFCICMHNAHDIFSNFASHRDTWKYIIYYPILHTSFGFGATTI